jgi:hypothetical protein
MAPLMAAKTGRRGDYPNRFRPANLRNTAPKPVEAAALPSPYSPSPTSSGRPRNDYDGEEMSVEDARDLLVRAGITAILYTSPSHTVAKPRWRVLCPSIADGGVGKTSSFMTSQ